MRRIALVLATVGLVAAGLAGTPAQARDGDDGWRGAHPQQEMAWRGQERRGDEWREHHRDWQAVAFQRQALPQIIFGLFHH